MVDSKPLDCKFPIIGNYGRGGFQWLEARKAAAQMSGGLQKKKTGNVLLSRGLRHSTIAAGELNCRVRNGNECFLPAMVTGKILKKEIA